jgi:deoxycytidylate deaminase
MIDGPLKSIHAEHNALQKFMRLNKKRRLVKNKEHIDIVVIRLTRSGVIGYSRPCMNCLLRLTKSGISINNVYYSDGEGSIICERFNNMFNSQLTALSAGDRRKKNGVSYNYKRK